jgi:hypothetical protein
VHGSDIAAQYLSEQPCAPATISTGWACGNASPVRIVSDIVATVKFDEILPKDLPVSNELMSGELEALMAGEIGCRCGSLEGEQTARLALFLAINQLAARATTTNAVQSLVYSYAILMGATAGTFPSDAKPAT